MAGTEEKKPFEQAVRSWQSLSDDMVRSAGRLAEAWAAANAEFLSGAIRASADLAVDFSQSLAEVPSKRRTANESSKAGLSKAFENGMDDAVNTADAVTHSVANGMERSAKVISGAWDVFASRYRDKGTTSDVVSE